MSTTPADMSFAEVYAELLARRYNEHIEASALASVCEQLAGPWGRVPGDGAMIMEIRERPVGHMEGRRGVVLPPEVRVSRMVLPGV